MTKNGKTYENVIMQDKTGTIDSKIWDPNSQGIEDFEVLDYVDIMAEVTPLSQPIKRHAAGNLLVALL